MEKKNENVMLKRDLVDEVSNRTMLNRREVKLVLNTIIDVIEDALREGKKVKISGFGSFSLVRRRGRRVKPIGKEEMIKIPDRITPKFSFSYSFVRKLRREA